MFFIVDMMRQVVLWVAFRFLSQVRVRYLHTHNPYHMPKVSTQTTIDYAERWLDIIKEKQTPTIEEADWIASESLANFREHFNAGWLEYRKSVTLAGDHAAIEWK